MPWKRKTAKQGEPQPPGESSRTPTPAQESVPAPRPQSSPRSELGFQPPPQPRRQVHVRPLQPQPPASQQQPPRGCGPPPSTSAHPQLRPGTVQAGFPPAQAPIPGPQLFASGRPPSGQAPGSSVSPGSQAPFSPQPRAATPASAQPPAASASVSAITGQVAALSIEEKKHAPASSKALSFPARPGYGRLGFKCVVRANHFPLKISIDQIFHYDVSINPEVKSRGVNRVVIDELVKCYSRSHLGGRLPAYDGRKSLYTSKKLPFTSQLFEVRLNDEDSQRSRTFKVTLKLANTISLEHLQRFISGKQADVPQEALQAVDVVLRESANRIFTPSGRSYYSPSLGVREISAVLEGWKGFFKSVRPTQEGLSLNLDLSATAFIQALPVVEYLERKFNRKLDRVMSENDTSRSKRWLRQLKVEVTHRGSMKRKYRVLDITPEPTRDLTFPDENGNSISVVQYFRDKYHLTLRYPHLPCLRVGNPQRLNYLPMEVCKIKDGQRYPKRLEQKEVDGLRVIACPKPQEREAYIKKCVNDNAYDRDQFAREFGVTVQKDLATVNARVLPAPKLKYHDIGHEKVCEPRYGKWNMDNKRMVEGVEVRWAFVSFASRLYDDQISSFCSELARGCTNAGMTFPQAPVCKEFGRDNQVESTIRRLCAKLNGALDLLVVILPEANKVIYGDVKRTCETTTGGIGWITQCCLDKNVRRSNPRYFTNVALKINAKLGGQNTVLLDAMSGRIPLITDCPTIVFGADVTHPQPGEDSASIAAVVASMDWPGISKYSGVISSQPNRKEIIENLAGMVRDLMLQFYSRTGGRKPGRIIFYRDGVSEGQFLQVLREEAQAIANTCASIDKAYRPLITFVIVQKRHHTRLFPADARGMDRSGNVQPGTVVDTSICHPREFDFYLCSHAGIQGTSKPAHYHVLLDENKFTADGLQKFTNDLCYTYARSTTAVSYVPPAYYAHLAAFRARHYMPSQVSDGESGGTARQQQQELPRLHERVKFKMFYC